MSATALLQCFGYLSECSCLSGKKPRSDAAENSWLRLKQALIQRRISVLNVLQKQHQRSDVVVLTGEHAKCSSERQTALDAANQGQRLEEDVLLHRAEQHPKRRKSAGIYHTWNDSTFVTRSRKTVKECFYCQCQRNRFISDFDEAFLRHFSSLSRRRRDVNGRTVTDDDAGDFVLVERVALSYLETLHPSTPEEAEEVDSGSGDMLWPKLVEFELDDLYGEVLYTVVNAIGCDGIQIEGGEERVLAYLRQVFNVDADKHERLMSDVRQKAAPQLVLNLKVSEAKNLRGKDVNGLSDPFCTLYMLNDAIHKHNTAMKPNTLSPKWKEYFSFPISNVQTDSLIVEVWDYDPEETLTEKMKRIGEVKNPRGLKKLVKEIALKASATKTKHEFLGCLRIPVNNIPSSGLEKWFPLEGRGATNNSGNQNSNNKRQKSRGEILLRLGLGSKKDKAAAFQEYRQLLHVLLVHQLDRSKVDPYAWDGHFCQEAEILLAQHATRGSLTAADVALARWVVFCNVHCDHPLHFSVFSKTLQQLNGKFNGQDVKSENGLQEEEERLLWIGADSLLDKAAFYIRTKVHLHNQQSGNLVVEQIQEALKALSILKSYLTDPRKKWKVSPTVNDISERIELAVKLSAEEFIHSVKNKNPVVENGTSRDVVEQLANIVCLLRTDLQRCIQSFHRILLESLNVNFFTVTYIVYDQELVQLVREPVKSMCDTMKPLTFDEASVIDSMAGNQHFNLGTSLFGLYRQLQQFSKMGTGIEVPKTPPRKGSDDTPVGESLAADFHLWFKKGVPIWLDIALYLALRQITKAVHLDKMKRVDTYVRHSSSPIDTVDTFYQIKKFWVELSWPDVEGKYAHAVKILDDICRSSIYYAEMMSKRVSTAHRGVDGHDKYEVTNDFCTAVNNIDYVRENIEALKQSLDLESVLAAIDENDGSDAAQQCQRTLEAIADNARENVEHFILEMLESVGRNMAPGIYRFLLEGADKAASAAGTNEVSVDQLMKYLDANLTKLNAELSQQNFDRVFSIIWDSAAGTIHDLIESNIEKRRPPAFFHKIHETLRHLIEFFYGSEDASRRIAADSTLSRVIRLLKIHGTETWELMHQYYIERYAEQVQETAKLHAPPVRKNDGGWKKVGDTRAAATTQGAYGTLVVRAQTWKDHPSSVLRLEIMNARNVKPMNSNGSCDPYVKIHLVPEEKFPNKAKVKTKTHKNTLFPLFDEIFTFPLTKAELTVADASDMPAFLVFTLKDHDLLYTNQYIAEAYLPLNKVPRTSTTTELRDLEQIHLVLGRPTNSDSEVLQALESRHWDKMARDFIKKHRSKLSLPC